MTPKKIRNIGILAHVDAGKTTLTEQFLFLSGALRTKGSVDKGTSHTDFLDIERKRGISVQAAQTTFRYMDYTINLIDTPGHADFAAEVERALPALDCAVLLISAADGVQAHTELLWQVLQKRQIPTLFFVNKIDRPGIDTEQLINEIKKALKAHPIPMQEVTSPGEDGASLESIWDANAIDKMEPAIETLAHWDEQLLEAFLEEKLPPFEKLDRLLIQKTRQCQIQPLFFGSAKNETGLNELLQAIIHYLPSPAGDAEAALSGMVYKVSHDKTLGRLCHVRLFNGQIQPRELVQNLRLNKEEKINLLRRANGGKLESCDALSAGDVGVVAGFSEALVGDILGTDDGVHHPMPLSTPLFTVQAKALQEKDYAMLAEALQILYTEDPRLDLEWLREEREFHLKVMGWMQMETLTHILDSRFKLAVEFSQPTVIYKETPAVAGYGNEAYTMPKPCWAVVRFYIEPGETGSGVVYQSQVSTDIIHQKYQNEVKRSIREALRQGPKGWEVTDVKITLVDGEDHEIHSRPGDFIIATPMGIMNGLAAAGTRFLEPIVRITITAPEELLGKVAGDLTQMRGSFANPEIEEGRFTLQALVPLATSMDYPIKLSSRSGGKARISSRFHGYAAVEDELGQTREYRGISPLDRSKYILWRRKAITL